MIHKTNSKANRIDWVTPRYILDALGEFDLDPCAGAVIPWPTAREMVSPPTDGLRIEWHGRVWLNPPYGNPQNPWLKKLRDHGNGIALVPVCTETKERWFRYVWGHNAGICYLKGRISFHHPDGSLPGNGINQACCLIAYGKENLAALLRSGLGAVMVEVRT